MPRAAPIDVLDLAGDARARGKAFGAARRKQIQACTVDWLTSLHTAGVTDPKRYIAHMLRETHFWPAIREYTPDLLEEVEGIADGAGQPLDLLLGAQLMDEEWAFRPSVQRPSEGIQKCSSVAIMARPGLTWIGQNMDLGGYTDGHQLVLRIGQHTPERGALVFTIGGMIGLMGVNARGVGVCVNSLPQLPAARQGLPVAFVIRKLLQAETVEEAAHAVRAVRHATGQHYLIADPTGIRSFEASAAGVVEYHSPNPARVLHTNHPLGAEQGKPYPALSQANTVARLTSLTKRLMSGEPDIEAIKAALSSTDDPEYPVCRVLMSNGQGSPVTGMIGFTTGSIISELRQDAHTVDSWVSAGPPNVRAYNHVRLGGVADC